MLQVCEAHERRVEIVQLQYAGQKEEARDQDAAEQLGQSKRLQANVSQPGNADVRLDKGAGVRVRVKQP